MNKTEIQLKERCEILEKILVPLSSIYFNEGTTNNQKRLIETTIGADIFYLPQGMKYWTGKISKGALEALKTNPKTTLTKEHEFPRKIAAKELLKKYDLIKKGEITLIKLYEEIYGRFNYVTPQENKKVSKFQKDGVFVEIDSAYANAGIELVKISSAELSNLKKGKGFVILH